jgi:cell division protein FtsW
MSYPAALTHPESHSSDVDLDKTLLMFVGMLLLLGGILVMSSSSAIAYARDGQTLSIFFKHLIRVGVGTALMIGLAFYDYHRLEKIAAPLMAVSLFLLVLVLFWPLKQGVTSHRWLSIGPLSIQPAEIAKLALVLYLARRLSMWRSNIFPESERNLLTGVLLVIGITAGLILCETNLSMALLILATSFAMLFLSGVSLKSLRIVPLAAAPALGCVFWVVPYTRARVAEYFAGLLDPSNACFQVRQSVIGLGKGGLSGAGLGHSTWAHFRLPIPYKDSIFCILGEELGFLGCLGLLTVFGLFLWRGLHIARKAPDAFGYFLACGLLLTLVCAFFINVGVSVGLLPPTGQPLPFISYGGSALVMSLAAVGVLLNIHRQGKRAEEPFPRPSCP